MPRGVNIEKVSQIRRKLRHYGNWRGVRWLRRQGVEFEAAYFLMFGQLPRR